MHQTPTIFDSVLESSVVFCLDVSGSMRAKLPAVIAELSEALTQRASKDYDRLMTRFNFVRFGYGVGNDSAGVELWSEYLAECTERTIADALLWLDGRGRMSSAGCRGSSADTRRALAAALAASVDAGAGGDVGICLVTDSLPEVPLPLPTRPTRIHCVYPKSAELPPQPGLLRELYRLSSATGGSMTVANVGHRGRIERVTPVARFNATYGIAGAWTDPKVGPSGKHCSVTTALRCDPLMDAPPTSTPWSRLHEAPWADIPWSKLRVSGLPSPALPPPPPPPMAGVALVGRRILGRREADGKFYEGTVIGEEEAKPGHFKVELNVGNKDGFATVEFQTSPVGELISYDDALLHQILPGDCVLAPRGNSRFDFSPAVVLDGYERRQRRTEAVSEGCERNLTEEEEGDLRPLAIAFTDGASCVLTEPRRAVRITHDLYHRLELESTMPRRHRLGLADSTISYPEVSRPGYPTSGPQRDPPEFEAVRPVWLRGCLLPEARFVEENRYKHGDYCPEDYWYDSDIDNRVENLIAEYDAHQRADVGVSTESRKKHSVVRFKLSQSKSTSALSKAKVPPPPFWTSAKSAPQSHASRQVIRSANLYDRRPPELGARIGASREALDLEARQRRVEEHRRTASAERAAALKVRRAVVDSVTESKLERRRDAEIGRRHQHVADLDTGAAGSEKLGRRPITPQPPGSPRTSRRRLLAAPAQEQSSVERQSRLRYLEAPKTETRSDVDGGKLRRSVRFSGSEPTVASWLHNQDRMNAAEVRSSAKQLAARHQDCHSGMERMRLTGAAPVPA